jgi:nucleoside-diphosphate-sugar epimerase
MRILLTGGTGFIGSHVARTLVRDGHEVYLLLRPKTNPTRIRDVLPKVYTVSGDVLDAQALAFEIQRLQPECCIHLAWYVEAGKYLAAPQNLDFLVASIELAKALAAAGCRRLVAAGTCFEYNTDLGTLRESSATRPRHLYSACKLALYTALEAYSHNTGMEFVWLRFFYQYGPFEDPRRLVPHLVNSLLRGEVAKLTPGEQVRDFLYIEDLADAVSRVVGSKLTGAVNIGSGQPITVREIAQAIGRRLDKPDLIALGAQPYVPQDPMRIVADITKLQTETGWRPRFDLDDGLGKTIEYWKLQRINP